MFRFKGVRNLHRDWAVLTFAAVLVAAANLLAVRTDSAAIPEHLLDRVRGANPDYNRYPDGWTCTTLNVFGANAVSPPPVPPYVSWAGCGGPTPAGSPCITCKEPQNQYQFDEVMNAQNPCDYKTQFLVNCNGAGGTGQLGACVGGACSATGTWDCDLPAQSFSLQ